MNVSAQNVATLVDNMLERVRNGELSTDQGLSFLEMKYNMLLSYLINLTYVVLRKCLGEKIEGDPCIDRLVEIRTVLEKIRPIDYKLKYQIDKLVKSAVSGTGADDPMMFKPKPEDLMKDDSGSEEESDEEENQKKVIASGIYVPPKLSAVHYTGDESIQERNKRLQERNKKHTLSTAILDELRDEYLDTPVELSQSSRAQQIVSKQHQERQQYEEEYLTRLPINKKEKHMRRQLTTLGTLGEEVTDFGSTKPGGKRKRTNKLKSRRTKRKRFH